MTGPTGWDGRPLRFPSVGDLPLLSRVAVDRMAERRAEAGWLAMPWLTGKVRVLRIGSRGEVAGAAVPDGPQAVALPWESGPDVAAEPPPELLLLGRHEGLVFTAVLDDTATGPGLRELGAHLGPLDAALLAEAVALASWHRTHPFCPGCGSPTVLVQSGWARRCPVERVDHFPRTDPAVIMLVTSPDGAKAILGRQPTWPAGRYSCLAGFVEAGESAEQAVVRETYEEAGVRVRDVVASGSQPWPFPRSLMLGFRAVADADAQPRQVDGELADVRWFTRDEVAQGAVMVPPPLSIANHLIGSWIAEGS